MDVMQQCLGLMYADNVVSLESKIEDCQQTLDGIWEWGQRFGMDLGLPKSGVLMWPSDRPPALRKRMNAVFEFEDDGKSDVSSVEGVYDWVTNPMDKVEFQHSHYQYSIWEGIIPTVKMYKYLGITVNLRLGHLRKVIAGERSMEYDFAVSQAKKGIKVLHTL